MAETLLPDEPWSFIEPLLSARAPSPRGGRLRLSDRAAQAGILFLLKTGIQLEYLPQEPGCGSGVTCWRRLRDLG
jgi:transposase